MASTVWNENNFTHKLAILPHQNTALTSHVCVCPSQAWHLKFSQLCMVLDHKTIYFLKGNDIRTSKTMFPGVWRANTQIQIHKYTNTASVKVADRPNMCYIFEKVMVRGPQKNVHEYLMCKYTNAQIQKYTNTQIHK